MSVYACCFLCGALLGFLANEYVDRFGCTQRYHSPLPKKLFIVFGSGLAAVFLYFWEVQNQMLLPVELPKEWDNVVLYRYTVHLLLLTFLLAATLTDFYEMIIPDAITVIGTFFALIAASRSDPLFYSALPATELYWSDTSFLPSIIPQTFAMHVWSPNPVETYSWLTMWFITTLLLWFWCFAMLDRVWYARLPIRKAAVLFCRYLYRSPRTPLIVAISLAAPLVLIAKIAIVTESMFLSALTGMAIGMVLIWAIRLVARWVLGIEAMGFGDVTLMGMIGAFLGWQAVLLIFFLAPFFGLIYGIIHWLLGRGRAVPYGPFLCLATVVVILAWSPIWSAMAEYFSLGIGTIGIALLVLLILFGGLLHVVHQFFSRLRRE